MKSLAAAAAGVSGFMHLSRDTSVNSVANRVMELEFDKEIDSLLRKADRGALVGDKPGETPQVHLDVDQLSAFVENVVPEKPRALYMSHLADCDRCRRILSGLIALTAEAEPAEERIVAPATSLESVEPWYRRLLFPNLAYVMGGLVLVFGGLIAISVLQSSDREATTVSQSDANAPAARGPMFEESQGMTDQMANTNATSSVANSPAMAQASNTSANAANAAGNSAKVGADVRRDAAPADEAKISTDGVDATKPLAAAPAAAPPPTMATPAPRNETADVASAAEAKDDDAKARTLSKKKAEDLEQGAKAKEMARTQAGGVAKSTPGPSREAQQNFPNRANNTFDMFEEKRVSGKGFQRRNNVWYDNSYRGQTTTNFRRGTEDYRKLDSGLRTIAESLTGVVVVVWEGKAYRIQ